jgi:hypothetical protein
MTAASNAAIRRTILDFLLRSDPYGLPETVLKREVKSALRVPVTDAQWDDNIIWLQSRTYIVPQQDEYEPESADAVVWLITRTGRSFHKSNE